MKFRTTLFAMIAAFFTFSAASAQTADPDYDKVVGKWKWEDIVVEVSRCAETELCAKVVEGASKCGGKMIRSVMTKVDANNGTGEICHPKDGKIYKSKVTYVDADTVSLKGSSGGTVAEGTFTRVK